MLKAKIFLLGLCLLLLFALLPVSQVFAASMDVLQGLVGTTVTISGPGLTSGQNYIVIWDGITYTSGVVSTANTATFIVPEVFGGSHTVVVQSPSGTQVISSYFTVAPSIAISTTSGIVGSSITVSGKGFITSEANIQVIYDSNSIKSGITADSNGSWSASFTVPSSRAGSHTIDASGATTLATSIADKSFTVKPAISVTPSSCGVGCTITITGSGFADSETSINVLFDGTTIKSGITADSNGVWSTTSTIPNTYSGSHTVDASGSTTVATDVTDASFTVVSGISVDKTSGYVGDVIVVTGTGFAASETNIYVTFDGTNQGSGTSADATGQWKISLSIPAAVNGTHTIGVRGSVTSTSTGKELTILPKIILNPNGGNVGDTITINGTGFAGGKTIGVLFGTVSVLNGNTDSSGSFNGTFKAPKGAGGDIKVVATDANNVSATFVFAMDKTAPSVPQIKSPAKDATVGFTGDTKVDFKWTEVTDPSGISYDIQVAKDADFKDIVFGHSGLTTTEYKSLDTEALPHGEYYWRVRAIDGATNASDWTAKTPFKSGLISLVVLIIIIVVVVVALIALRVRAIMKN